MKFKEPISIVLKPNYSVFEGVFDASIYENIPRDPRFDGQPQLDEDDPRYGKYCGGRFDWGIHVYPENPREDMTQKIHLMRLWVTTMYTQMAAGLSYHAQGDSNIKVNLTQEELDTLAKINGKICESIFNEMWLLDNTFMRKKSIKKLGFE